MDPPTPPAFVMYLLLLLLVTFASSGGDSASTSTGSGSSATSTISKRHNNNDKDLSSNVVQLPSTFCRGVGESGATGGYPLGMESGAIPDDRLVASSSYSEQSVGPQNARLNRELSAGAWCPQKQLNAEYSGTEWIQVDLAAPYVLTGVATQGRFGNGLGVEFAEQYWIEYSRDNGSTWNKWSDRNGDYKLEGNKDTYTAHKNQLSHPLVGVSLLRIVPYANYQRTTCLRFELYGCRTSEAVDNGGYLPVSYAAPDGFKESSFGDLRDLTYDGRRDYYGYLNGGLGQLTDGIRGDDNYKVNYGYEWVGWRADGPTAELSLVFQFDTFTNFSSVSFYTHNLFSKDVQVFAGAKVWFSYDGSVWSKRPVEFEYMPDLALENAREVVVHLHHRAGLYVKFDLAFAAKWILISEVTFKATPVEDNFTISYEHLESPLGGGSGGFFSGGIPGIAGEGGPNDSAGNLFPQRTFLIVFALLLTIICSVVFLLLRLHLRRKEKSGHIVVCMKDLATTPLYCEPKDFSSTSSTISNAVTDPEYAVPDVALGHHHLHNHNHNQNGSSRLNNNNNNNNNLGNGSSGSGHLNSNLNMFGAGFTRIFMGGQTLGGKHGNGNSGNKTTAPIPVNAATLHGSFAHLNGNNTSNVAYSGKQQQQQQQFPAFLSDAQRKNGGGGSSYSVNLNSKVNGYVNPLPVSAANGRQYYASTDLMMVRSPKNALKNAEQSSSMTSNTIYNKRKQYEVSGDTFTGGTAAATTLKLKYHNNSAVDSNGHSNNSLSMDETMKCIPEVSEADVEVLRGAGFGASRYGEVLLARFKDNHHQNRSWNHNHRSTGNEVSSAETTSAAEMTADKTASGTDETLVVLKTLEKEKLRPEFLHEMKSKWFISAKSERVAKLIGYLSGGGGSGPNSVRSMAMVLECGNCDLAHYLRTCDKKVVGLPTLLHIGAEVAAGMKYLETLGYVHRDLAARNCIIYTATLQVKITDIAALVAGNAPDYCNGVAIRWAAPEALLNGAYSTKSDVYSYGVTLWEVLTYGLIRPHPAEATDEEYLGKVITAYEAYVHDCAATESSSIYYQATYGTTGGAHSTGSSSNSGASDQLSAEEQQQGATNSRLNSTRLSYRLALQRPTTCPPEIYDLMLECWSLNEHARPSFREITAFLQTRINASQTSQALDSSGNGNAVVVPVYA